MDALYVVCSVGCMVDLYVVCSIGSMVDLFGCAVCCVFCWVYGRSVWMRCMLCVLLGVW